MAALFLCALLSLLIAPLVIMWIDAMNDDPNR